MPSKSTARNASKKATKLCSLSSLKKDDLVMVISGGSKNRDNKGKTGKILAFVGKDKSRVIVEGVNLIIKHQKQNSYGKSSGKITTEGSIHISNVMYYSEKLNRPVRLKHRFLEDGSKVRGYIDPVSKDFVQI